jgi:hypothetical protein
MAITLDGTAGITASGSLTTSSSLTTGTGAVYNGLQASTAVATTSGTSITFSSIPSWVKRITVMFQGVSTSGTSLMQIQIGAGSVTTSGYANNYSFLGASTVSTSAATSGFIVAQSSSAAQIESGFVALCLLGSNNWVESGNVAETGGARICVSAGSIALGGTLDRVVLTTVNGTDTFDAGSINILYE